MYVEFFDNVVLLLALSAFYGILSRVRENETLRSKVLDGLLFGGMAIVAMSMPLSYRPGIIYDGRSIVLGMAGLFGGGVAAVVAVVAAGAYRAFMGGAGVWAGIATVVVSSLVGLAFRRVYHNRPETMRPSALYGLGIITSIGMLFCQLLLPRSVALSTIHDIWLPVMLVFPAATLLTGILLRNETLRIITEKKWHENEISLKKGEKIAGMGGWDYDSIHDKTTWSENLFSLFGLKPFEIEPSFAYFKSRIHPDDIRLLDAASERIQREKGRVVVELRLLFPDGNVRWIQNSIVPVFQGDQLVRLQGVNIDITERKEAEQRIEQLNRVNVVLRHVNQTIVRTKERTELLKNICRVAVEQGGFVMAWIGCIDSRDNTVRAASSFGRTGDYLDQINIDLNDKQRSGGPTGSAIRTGRHCIVNNILQDDAMRPWRENAVRLGYQSSAAFPLTMFGTVVGALNLYSPYEFFFDDDEVGLLDEMAMDISYALEAIDNEKERKRSEHALKEREQQYKALFVDSASIMLLIDPENGLIVDANRAACEFYGYVRDQLIGMKIQDINTLTAEQVAEELPQALHEKRNHFFFQHRMADGTVKPVEVYSGPVKRAGKSLLYSIIHDITERFQAEAERERLITALEHAGEAVIITDPDGTIRYVNQSLERITGYTRDEVLGKNPRLFQSGRHDKSFCREMWQTISSGKVWNGRIVNKKKDGSLYTELMTISPVFDAAGVISSFVAIKCDISEHLKLEEQFYQAQKMESVGKLAGGVAHDFNNMLTIILGYAEMAMDELGREHPLYDPIHEIYKAALKSRDITRQLLAFSRRQPLAPVVLDLNESVKNLEKMLGRLIGEDIDFKTVQADTPVRVKADPGQIEQIIMNLAVNARDAMPDGGKLTIETSKVEINDDYADHHLAVTPGKYVMLAVTDTGCGMDKATVARVFEPFFTTKEVGTGTGLGLATVYGIVKQSGGNIWCYSEPGRGTTFKIYLPRTDAEPVAPARQTQSSKRRGGGEHILVAEDEAMLRELMDRMLKRSNYDATVVENGEEALRLIEEEGLRPDLVITDIIMPGMSGKELITRLQKTLPGLRFLYMSGYTDNAIVHHGVLDPGTPFIQKPFNRAALAAKIESLMRQD